MARTTKPLSNTQIEKAKPKDKDYPLYDGQGLFLSVKSNGSKLWRFNYYKPLTSPPKRTEISLGAFPDVSLSEARAMREEYRALIAKGIDPKIHRDHHAETLSNNTFKAVCEKWFTEIYPLKATSEETRTDNWKRMKKHIFPKIGDLPLRDITPRLLISLYSTIGASNTLDKLHRIIKSTLDHGVKMGVIEMHNCDIAKDDFIAPLAKSHPAIDFEELPTLLGLMNQAFDDGRIEFTTFFAFNLTLLTGLRQKELTGLEWAFIDEQQGVLTIPSHLLKQTRTLKEQPRDHIIYLSTQMKTLLNTVKRVNGTNRYLFPKTPKKKDIGKPDKPMDRETISKALNRILEGTPLEGKQDAHGLRSIFRTYLTSKNIPLVVAELALAHLSTGKDKVQAVYDRFEYHEERKQATQLFSDYCEQCGMRLTI